MFNLFGRVQLDAAGFHRGLNTMKIAAAPAGKEIGAQLKSGMLAFMGAGAFIGAIRSALTNATEIRRGSGQSGLDPETYQALKAVADESGVSLQTLAEKMMDGSEAGNAFKASIEAAKKELQGMGQIIDSGTVNSLDETATKFAQIKNAVGTGLMAGINKAVDLASRAGSAAEAGARILWGKVTGNETLEEQGRLIARQAFGTDPAGQDESVRSGAVAAAATSAKAIGKETGKAAAAEAKTAAAKLMTGFDASSETRVGARFGMASPNMRTPAVVQLETLNKTVAKLAADVSTFK